MGADSGPPENPLTSQHYGIDLFKEGPLMPETPLTSQHNGIELFKYSEPPEPLSHHSVMV